MGSLPAVRAAFWLTESLSSSVLAHGELAAPSVFCARDPPLLLHRAPGFVCRVPFGSFEDVSIPRASASACKTLASSQKPREALTRPPQHLTAHFSAEAVYLLVRCRPKRRSHHRAQKRRLPSPPGSSLQKRSSRRRKSDGRRPHRRHPKTTLTMRAGAGEIQPNAWNAGARRALTMTSCSTWGVFRAENPQKPMNFPQGP